MRRIVLLLFLSAGGCASLTPEGARIAVYRAPLDGAPSERRMPEGCRLLSAKPSVSMTELEMEGQNDPFRASRNEAAAAGANVLLVLSRLTVGRRDLDCPGSSPITDCPPSEGAWFEVVLEAYACSPDALEKLRVPAGAAAIPPVS
jgi:hypothetical protein